MSVAIRPPVKFLAHCIQQANLNSGPTPQNLEQYNALAYERMLREFNKHARNLQEETTMRNIQRLRITSVS